VGAQGVRAQRGQAAGRGQAWLALGDAEAAAALRGGQRAGGLPGLEQVGGPAPDEEQACSGVQDRGRGGQRQRREVVDVLGWDCREFVGVDYFEGGGRGQEQDCEVLEGEAVCGEGLGVVLGLSVLLLEKEHESIRV
jgi:hypothetical protein